MERDKLWHCYCNSYWLPAEVSKETQILFVGKSETEMIPLFVRGVTQSSYLHLFIWLKYSVYLFRFISFYTEEKFRIWWLSEPKSEVIRSAFFWLALNRFMDLDLPKCVLLIEAVCLWCLCVLILGGKKKNILLQKLGCCLYQFMFLYSFTIQAFCPIKVRTGQEGSLLLLKVWAFSRVPSCWRRACRIPALLRDTGRVRDFLSAATGPAPSWLLLGEEKYHHHYVSVDIR